jgi:hypothetical protein
MQLSYRLPEGATIIGRSEADGGRVLVSAPDLPDFQAWFADDVWWRGTFGYEVAPDA